MLILRIGVKDLHSLVEKAWKECQKNKEIVTILADMIKSEKLTEHIDQVMVESEKQYKHHMQLLTKIELCEGFEKITVGQIVGQWLSHLLFKTHNVTIDVFVNGHYTSYKVVLNDTSAISQALEEIIEDLANA